ncbi:TetR/AcrR family transcriptional regulator [Rhodococcus sp. WS4]|nr:TetR/AcrR family transcriptional regulator [Rhodococcus sp. WS4]
MTRAGDARDRLLLAAAQLLEESGDRTVSTRAVCERAGVQAPTLYHHFGNKQGLIDAVLNHGFTQFVAPAHAPGVSEDPLDDVRAGWDRHVEFGLTNPTFYALLYGRVEPGTPCSITAPALTMLVELLDAAARAGALAVPPRDAAAQLLAANVGVTLALITQPEGQVDQDLSGRVREAAIAGVVTHPSEPRRPGSTRPKPTRASAAVALRALVEDDPDGLSPGESALLQELLDRLSTP